MVNLPYIVLDQNVLRDEARIKKAIHLVPGGVQGGFLLPDVAIMEMLKSKEWEYTLRRSLEFLVSMQNRVFVSWGIGELLRKERELG